MALLNFDATQIAPDQGKQDALPAGWYNVAIDASEVKPTSQGNGSYLELRFNILDGIYMGKKAYSRLNIQNANPVAQEIGYKQLSAVAHAVGVLRVGDSSQLHGIPLKVKLKYRAADGEYEASNDVTSYKNINEVVQQAPATGFAAPAAFAAPAQAAPVPMTQWQQPQVQAPQFAPVQPMQAQPQFAPVQQPAAQAPQQAWQQPQAAQPWAAQAAPQTAPVQQAQPVYQQPIQQMQQVQQVQQPVQQFAAPAQPQFVAPVQPAPTAAGAPPEWSGQNPQTATPPWVTQ